MAALETVDDQVALGSQALADAIEQQAATAEILRAISRSPADAQPGFEMIAAAALRRCRARSANVLRYDGTLLHVAALASAGAQGVAAIRSAYPRPADHGTTVGRAVITGGVVVIPDVLADPEYRVAHAAVSSGFRSVVGVPLLREGWPIGAIAVGRAEPGPFPASQVDLLRVFAEQAVIAIENTRLFNEREARNRELAEALEHQTATAEILRVLSQIPNDVQPVFEAIVNTGVRLFKGAAVAISRHHEGQVHSVAIAEDDPVRAARWREVFPFPLSREYIHGAAILDCRVVDVADVLVVGGQFEAGKRNLAPSGYRAMTVVPLVRDGVAIGAIAVVRMTPGALSNKQIALLQTFADQAVIAIENVRLFNEREARNRELSDALEQQTATSDILRVISESPTDVQPVLDAVAERAAVLCDARHASVFLLEDDMLWPHASHAREPGDDPGPADGVPLKRSLLNARAFLDRRAVHVADILPLLDTEYPDARDNQRRFGFRAAVAVPMIREERAIGTIFAWRREARAFAATEIALLQTFADQAVIAIENARLFNETKEALAHRTAASDVLQVISGSMADATPVFGKILDSCEHLFGATDLGIFLVDGQERLNVGAWRGSFADWTPGTYPRPLAGTMSEMVMRHGALMHWGDVEQAQDIPDYIRAVVRKGGNFAVASAPLAWEGRGIGTIDVMRKPPRAYSEKELALLATFADQAVIAIQNARLFNETQQALARQTATSEVLRVISGSVTDTQPVFDVIAERAARLTGAKSGWVFTFDGEWIHGASAFGLNPEAVATALALFPMRPSGASYTSRAIRDGVVMNVADALAETDPEYATKPVARLAGYRGVLSVPMFRGQQVLGAISVNRSEVGLFGDKEVELLRTFADQAVIAIENTRLSNEREARNLELAEALEQQTATSEILRVIARSPSDVQPVFQTIADAALRLCDASVVNMLTFDGALLHAGALAGLDGEGLAAVHALYPRPPARDTVAGVAVLTGEVFVIEDVLADPHYSFKVGAQWGVRSALGIPLLRQGAPIGALAICRPVAGPFPDKLVALLRIFADQAVIAIENVRLFHEIEDKSRELEVASRHKSAFLANMSHELRTPMNAILGFTRIVLRETRERIEPKQAENLEKILASARHLVGLINATLDLTRIEAGRIEIIASDIALAPLLDECLRSVEPLLNDGVGLGCRIAPDLPPMRVDAEKLRQIVINLLSNAVKFTERGQIDVRASRCDGRVEIEVADSGIGIPADKLEAIFEEFEQVDASHTRAHGGTGLGLAIARRLARAMGGELSARSALGAGSTFRLDLPLHYRDPDEA